MKSSIVFLLVSLSVFSCREAVENRVSHRDGVTRLTIDPLHIADSNLFASALIDSFIYIPLETSEDVVVGRIKALYEWKDRFYILDEQTNAILVFSQEGKFLKQIRHIGRGPEEYMRISSFYHNPRNGDIYIHCDRSQAILCYDEDGNFLRRIPCKFITAGFTMLGEDSLALYGGRYPNEGVFHTTFPRQYRYVVMQGNEVLRKDLAWEYKEEFMRVTDGRNFFFGFSDTVSLLESFRNDVYRIGRDGELKLRFCIDFGRFTFPLTFDASPDEVRTIIETRKKAADKWCKMHRMLETSEFLWINYSFSGMLNTVFYSKRTERIYNIGPVWVNDKHKLSMPEISDGCGQVLLGYLATHVFLQSSGVDGVPAYIKEIAGKMNEMDNPVVVKMIMKKI